jgi:hypothetical protein
LLIRVVCEIIALILPAHATNLFQVLDLVFLGAMENNRDSLANEPEVASVTGEIIRAYEQTATSAKIRSCLRKAGLSPNTQTRPFKLEFDREAVRQNDGFKALWDRNISAAELSRRRQLQTFGMLNIEFLNA